MNEEEIDIQGDYFNQLDYQEKSGLITADLKNPSKEPFTEEKHEDFKKELPFAFINYKLNSDSYYQQNPNQAVDAQTSGDTPPNEVVGEKGDTTYNLAEDSPTEIQPEESLAQDNDIALDALDQEGQPDLYSANPDDPTSDTVIPQFSEGSPFKNLDERFNFKDTLDPEFLSSDGQKSSKNDTSENIPEVDEKLEALDANKEKNQVGSTFDEQTVDEFNAPLKKDSTPNPETTKKISDEIDSINSEPSSFKGSDEPNTLDPSNDIAPGQSEAAETVEDTESSTENKAVSIPSTETEESLYNEHMESVTKFTDKKFNRQKLNEVIGKYHPENRKLIKRIIEDKELSETDKDKLINDIVLGKNEDVVVEELNQKILDKAGYEIFEQRNKNLESETKLFEKTFNQYRLRRHLILLFYTTTISLILLILGYFTYRTYAPIRLYKQAITAIEEKNYSEAEKLFDEAYQLNPDVHYINETGMAYARGNKISEAKDKFDLLLKEFPRDLDALLAAATFNRKLKRFDEAKSILKQARKLYPANPSQMNEEVNLLISESKTKDFNTAVNIWEQAKKINSDLLAIDPNNELKYIQRKVALAALSDEFNVAKNYFLLFKSYQRPYDFEPMSIYLDYLIDKLDKYQNRIPIISGEKISNNESIYIINTIEDIFNNLKKNYKDNYSLYIFQARWANINKKTDLALSYGEAALALIEQQKNTFLNDDLISVLNLMGTLQLKKKEHILAEKSFNRILNIDPENPLANYYLGKIHFLNHNQYQISYQRLHTAYNQWRDPNDIRYADILYTLGYIDFNNGKSLSQENSLLQKNHFQMSIFYWSELAKLSLNEKSYLIDFNLGTGYLYLKEYELAKIYYENNLKVLEPTLKNYNDRDNLIFQVPNIKQEELQILSDLYNNLAIAQLGREGINSSPTISGEAAEYFITSIILKDKLGDFNATPYANFNTLNDYPKKGPDFLKQRPFRIADASIPRTFLPVFF